MRSCSGPFALHFNPKPRCSGPSRSSPSQKLWPGSKVHSATLTGDGAGSGTKGSPKALTVVLPGDWGPLEALWAQLPTPPSGQRIREKEENRQVHFHLGPIIRP